MPGSNLILNCIYGTKDCNYKKELKEIPSLYSLFNVNYLNDKIANNINNEYKMARKTKRIRATEECPEYVFWVRLFQLLLNDHFYSYSLREINLSNDSESEALFGADYVHKWRSAYFNNSYGTAIEGNKTKNPLVVLNRLINNPKKYINDDDNNDVDLKIQLTSALLAEYIIGIYEYKEIYSLIECDEKNDPLLTGFKDNWLLKDLKGRDRKTSNTILSSHLQFKELIKEFSKEFVNTIRSSLGLPNEEQIIDTVNAINDDSNDFLTEPIKTRIGQNHYDRLSLFQKNNRFKYNSGKIDFQGRTTEIKTINKMCDSEEPFLWISITGKGGMGKTRLAYQMCKELKKEDWLTFEPIHSKPNAESIINKIENSDSNDIICKVFMCFDYVKFNIDAIKEIMLHLLDIASNNYRFRVVLIERDPDDIEISDDYLLSGYRYSDIPVEIASEGQKSIALGKLSREDYFAIIKQYYKEYTGMDAKNYSCLEMIYDKFEELDNQINRPLFALFITDAMIAGEDLNSWDEKDALRYFVNREQRRIQSVIDKYFVYDRIKSKNYFSAVRFILELATYLDGIELTEHSDLINNKFGIDVSDKALIEILNDIGFISQNNTVIATKPDLIGEFSTIEFFDAQSEEETQSFINYIIESDLERFLNHTKKMYDDYNPIINTRDWVRYIKTIRFPSNTNYVRHNLFCNNDFIEEVVLHGKVYEIGVAAFMNAKNLRIMTLPSSVELIDEKAFKGCISLTEIVVENEKCDSSSLIKIKKSAFKNCESLVSFNLPSSLQYIGESAFSGCTKLNNIVIPRKIKEINDKCFKGCISLSNCILPKELISIGNAAFSNSGINKITLPPSLKELKLVCFINCSMLETVSIAETSSIKIGSGCFKNCTMLSEINLENVSEVGLSAFWGCKNISSITINNPTAKIKEGAFINCSFLQIVNIANTCIDTLPADVFSNCSSLKAIELPKAMKRIGKRAFQNCSSLIAVELPHQITYIEEEAFAYCINLEKIKLPKSLKSISPKAFLNCKKISLSCFKSLEVQKMYELCGLSLKAVNEVAFPLLTLNAEVTSIDIPENVTMIKSGAFKGLTELVSVRILGNVFSIGDNAFSGCTKLKTVDLGKSHIQAIGKNAFSGCTCLSNINGVLEISIIEEGTFSNCERLKDVKTIFRINRIGRNAFLRCKNICIYQNGKNIFERFHELHYRKWLENGIPIEFAINKDHSKFSTKITVDGFGFENLGDNEIEFLNSYKKASKVVIPNSCFKISGNPFMNNTTIEEVIVPNGIEDLPDNIFNGCVNLKKVEFGSNITIIPRWAFYGCENLVSLKFGNLSENTIPSKVSIGLSAFFGCSSINKLELPDDIVSIPSYAFGNCHSLEIKKLPSSLVTIGKYAFAGCSNIETIVFPEKLETIGRSCFAGCTELIAVDLSKTKITNIQNNLFFECDKLERVGLPIKLKRIGPGAFKNCNMLSVIDLYNTSLTDIGVGAFQNCSSIKKISLPNGITRINEHCFNGCHAMDSICLPKHINSIGNSAFYKCIQLSEIELPDTVISLGIAAFSYSGLTHIEIPSSISELSNNLFAHCSKLTEVSIPSHITIIPNDCFKDCGFSSISLPDKLETISVGAFKLCFNLEKIKIPDTVTEIGASAFRSCIKLREFECPMGVRRINKSVFEDCKSLKSMKFGKIDTVDRCAFMNCKLLTDIDISLIEREIGYSSFQNCELLNIIKFSSTISIINTGAFMSCNSIERIELPSSIKKISGSAFRNIKKLKKVILPNIEELEIGKSTFRDCINLKDVVVNSKKLFIRQKAFKGCNSLFDFKIPEGSTIYDNSFHDCPDEKKIMSLDCIHIIEAND